MIIFGIDPALTKLGWSVLNYEHNSLKYINSGVIHNTNSKISLPIRLANITIEIDKLFIQYSPDIITMEETFINNNPASSLKLGYARGAIMALIGRHMLELKEFSPNLIKKTITGNGHAEKAQILHMIKLLIPGVRDIKSFDAADAIAVAYTYSVHAKSLHLINSN